MKKIIIYLSAFILSFFTISCCNCSKEEQKLTVEELGWIPDGVPGDTVVFSNEQGNIKTFRIVQSEEQFSKVKCAGPCCACPEDNEAMYEFGFYTDQNEGYSIFLSKTNNLFQMSFSWSFSYTSFAVFDYSIDTLTVRNKVYQHVYVKEFTNKHIRKLFFCKPTGLIRFDYIDGIWERLP